MSARPIRCWYYSGPRHQNLVATRTKKVAAELLRIPIREFNLHATETGNDHDLATALASEGTVFEREDYRDSWKAVW